MGNLEAWQLLLAGAAGLYLKEILKEAAKEHWRDRAKIFSALKARAVKPITDLAAAITRMRATCTPHTEVVLVLNWPDDFLGTRFHLVGRDDEALSVELAAFIGNADRIQETLNALEADGVKPMAPIQVHFLADGTLELSFIDEGTETERRFRLPANAA